MDHAEALRRIEDHERIHHIKERSHIYYLAEAFNIAKSALKKQIPMQHHHTIVGECSGGEKIRTSICPSCLGCIMTVPEEFPRFCPWCGQAIDWDK